MSLRMRLLVLGITTLVVLVLVNLEIAGKEQIVRDGTTLLLPLQPVDPRSLMQGDYMALRYAMTSRVSEAAETADTRDGVAIVALDEMAVATFVGLYDNRPLSKNQALLRFRKRGDSVRLASDAYFFEEGQLETYRNARYGELRVSADGDAVLTGLRNNEGVRLGKGMHK